MNKPIKFSTENFAFEAGTVLRADQLNTITYKVDQIIDYLPNSFTQTPTNTQPSTTTPSSDGLSEQDVIAWINDAKTELNSKITSIQSWIAQQGDGHIYTRDDEEMIELFKTPFKSLLVHYGITDENGNPFFNLFLEKNGITPAMISAWINKESSTSNIGISADYITIGGEVTLTNKLNALNVQIQDLNVTGEATIKKVVSDMVQAGDLTVTGDLNYNRLVGRVETISEQDGIMPDNTTYIKNRTSLIRFPKNPVVGQTIYVEGSAGNVLPSQGTSLLAGLVYDGTVEINIGEGSDTETYYKYRWSLVEYNNQLKPYNTKGYNNLKDCILHSYVYTGNGQWVETTPLPNISVTLSYTEKQRFGL